MALMALALYDNDLAVAHVGDEFENLSFTNITLNFVLRHQLVTNSPQRDWLAAQFPDAVAHRSNAVILAIFNTKDNFAFFNAGANYVGRLNNRGVESNV